MNRTEMMRTVAQEVAKDLALQPPFAARDLIDALQANWHIPVVLHPYASSSRVLEKVTTGWCAFVGDTFHIYYYADGTVAQRERIIYHELGHLVLRHVTPEKPSLRRRGSAERTESELLAEAFAEVMSELALFGDSDMAGTKALDAAHGSDPYVHFLTAQEH